MDVTIYHNPRCSKSRLTLQLLQSKNCNPIVVEYLKTPPSAESLQKILDALGMKPRDLIRTGEPVYKSENLGNPDLADDVLIRKMIENPILIERPVVVSGDKAAIGRPPEQVLEIL
ncbi:MAG: arsenate reductase (glutaredoxin) [Acidiferrobacterales bacterium]|nr:arsenate reductase (glutaredoxin) [Acidiferrobacterales bacterium]